MKRTYSAFLPFLVCSLYSMSGCITLSGYQTGRTLGKNNWEVEMAGNFFIAEGEPICIFCPPQEEELHLYPYGEMNMYYGVAENLDLGLRLSSSMSGTFTLKHQILGGKDSPGAVAIGGGFGIFINYYWGWDARLPLFFSTHPNDKLSLYASPQYIYQFGGSMEGDNFLYGSNFGMVIKTKKVDVGLDAGLFNLFEGDAAVEQIGTLGMSLKF